MSLLVARCLCALMHVCTRCVVYVHVFTHGPVRVCLHVHVVCACVYVHAFCVMRCVGAQAMYMCLYARVCMCVLESPAETVPE